MTKLGLKLKRVLGKFDTSEEYMVNISDILIPYAFTRHHPSKNKLRYKEQYYRQNGEFESPIVLDRNFVLADGYTTYIICRNNGIKKVSATFID